MFLYIISSTIISPLHTRPQIRPKLSRSFRNPCKKQACGLRDQFKQYKESNISILGISYDPLKRLKSFKQKNDIQFDFLSDSEKSAIERCMNNLKSEITKKNPSKIFNYKQ